MTILNPHLDLSATFGSADQFLEARPPPHFTSRTPGSPVFLFNLIDYYISVSSLRPHSHGFCYHPVSFPSPPDSHILLPSLLSIQASPPNVLIWYLHSFWFMATPPKSGVSLISLTSTDTHLQILLALPSKYSYSLNPSHHFHPIYSDYSQHYLSHTLLQAS